jgi:mycothiol synthase
MELFADQAAGIPDWHPPGDYSIRGYRPGDERQWLSLLLLAGFDEWTEEGLQKSLLEPERGPGSRLAFHRGSELVAASFASQRSANPPTAALDHVVAHPRHAGNQLGYGVCREVIRYLIGRSYPRIVLSTDDWRLPAITTYLKLGFKPVMCRSDMPERWTRVHEALRRPFNGTSMPGGFNS